VNGFVSMQISFGFGCCLGVFSTCHPPCSHGKSMFRGLDVPVPKSHIRIDNIPCELFYCGDAARTAAAYFCVSTG